MFSINNKLANNIITILIILITCLMIFGVMNLLNIKIEEGMENDGVIIPAAGGTVIYITNDIPASASNNPPTTSPPTTSPPTTSPPTTSPPPTIITPAITTKPPSLSNKLTVNTDIEQVTSKSTLNQSH